MIASPNRQDNSDLEAVAELAELAEEQPPKDDEAGGNAETWGARGKRWENHGKKRGKMG